MATGKRAFLFYKSNLDILALFPEEQQQEMALWIMQHGFDEPIDACPDEMMEVMRPIFDGIDTEKRRHNNVSLLNQWIEQLTNRTVDVAEQASCKKINNTLTALRRGIVKCQRADIPPEEVKEYIRSIVTTPAIRSYFRSSDLQSLPGVEETPQAQTPTNQVSPVGRYGPMVRR